MGIPVTTTMSSKQIADLFVTAFEGGSGYWCDSAHPDPEMYCLVPLTSPWYADPQYYDHKGWSFTVIDNDEGETHVVNAETVTKGMAHIAEKYPFRLGALLGDDHDAEDADVFLQCCALGEIIYG